MSARGSGAGGNLAVALLFLSMAQCATCLFNVEKGGLKITFPSTAKSKYPKGFDMALANFGAPRYGGKLMGKLVYVDKEYGRDATCSPACKYACQRYDKATPRVDFRSERENIILLVDRGPIGPGSEPCKFAEKVWNAQQAGARAVLVANYEDRLTTMEAADDNDEEEHLFLSNITVPASFVTRSAAEALRAYLKSGQGVYVSLDWTDALPKQQTVAWEFWTNSNDQCGALCDVQKQFIKEFVPVAKEFDSNGWTTFMPHYLVWDCPTGYTESEECQSQCIRHGRYCAPDPDGDMWEGYSGAQVVEENLRSLCVHTLAARAGHAHLWWDYVTRYGDACDMKSGRYGVDCAEETFAAINQDKWSSVQALRACVGNSSSDLPSDILEGERRGEHGTATESEVFILPTIRINGAQYRGKLATAEVLQALCAGFLEGNRPAACNKPANDPCLPGAVGDTECSARLDGKTRCQTTVAGYNCTCGQGFLPKSGPAGEELCVDVNECLSLASLEPECTCPRCACRNTYGSYECVPNLPDECAKGNGGCWQADLRAGGSGVHHFSACHDNIDAYKQALAINASGPVPPLHTCTCPSCFTAAADGGCTPKCDLKYCNVELGACLPTATSGLSLAMVATIVLGVAVALCLGGVVAYRLRLRSMMEAEVRAIMAEYMPLDQDAELTPHGGKGIGPAPPSQDRSQWSIQLA